MEHMHRGWNLYALEKLSPKKLKIKGGRKIVNIKSFIVRYKKRS